MFKILRHYGIFEQITNAIRLAYEGEIATDESEVTTGVLKDDVFAPYLFIVVINWMMRNANIYDLGFITH